MHVSHKNGPFKCKLNSCFNHILSIKVVVGSLFFVLCMYKVPSMIRMYRFPRFGVPTLPRIDLLYMKIWGTQWTIEQLAPMAIEKNQNRGGRFGAAS